MGESPRRVLEGPQAGWEDGRPGRTNSTGRLVERTLGACVECAGLTLSGGVFPCCGLCEEGEGPPSFAHVGVIRKDEDSYQR
jgi:hypothetical protein